MTTTATRKPAFDPHPADGDLALAVMLMALRMADARGDMMCAKLTEDVLRASRAGIRRSRALQRLVSALADQPA
jgi:hypothetical protein